MGKGSVANIVEQDGSQRRLKFNVTDVDIFLAKAFQGTAHQVQGAQCVMKSGMHRPGINKVAYTQLPDETQSLNIRMSDQVEDQGTGDGNKSIDRIVDNFVFVQGLKVIGV